jgi:hypothetical protein|tara:strand:- start:4826 stop:5197 length:372 start_codon:yes stop_codon:yes gene_type:complete
MAITLTNQTPVDLDQIVDLRSKTHWLVNFMTSDSTGNEIIRADPGSGAQLVLSWILINYPFADTVVLNEDTTAILGPFTMTATSPPLFLDFRDRPYPLAFNTALQIDTGGANVITGVAAGFTV